jgi:putative zinc finger/helix-turn-helix YgiT family protein
MYKQGDTCPLCGAGQLSEKVVEERFSYKGQTLTVPDYYILECPACGEAVVVEDSARRAEKLLRDFGREVDGLLTAPDIKRIRRKLHLTQEQMASVLGGGLKGFARYENGQVVQSRAMDNLLRILDRFPESLRVLQDVPQKSMSVSAGMVCEVAEGYKGENTENRQLPRIYIDTSVFGGCFDFEFAKESLVLFELIRSGSLRAVLSDIVLEELEDAPQSVRELVLSIPESELEYIDITEEILQLRNNYERAGILGPKWIDDMTHVAAATVARVDAIVSWNFKHIVRLDKMIAYNQVNLQAGYGNLTIITPKEAITYGND